MLPLTQDVLKAYFGIFRISFFFRKG